MATSKPSSQSAVARRSAETKVRGLVAKFAPAHRSLVGAARRWLRKRLPTAHEVVYEYRDCFVISCSPNGHGYDGVFAIRASAEGVRLYLNRGKGLPDPAKLLQGSGTQTHWIHLEGPSTLARPEVTCLVDQAIADNPVPCARTGRGPVVLRLKAAKAAKAAKTRSRRRPA